MPVETATTASASSASASSASASQAPAEQTAAPAPAAARPEHRYDIDLMRVIASCGVVLCHIAAEFMTAVNGKPSGGAPVYWTGLGADSLSRFAVPTFFAIAGWVVLVGAPPRDEKAMRRRIVKILVPLGVWTAIYLAVYRLLGWNGKPVGQLALDSLFNSVRPAFHLWYLYAYIPVIMLLALAILIRAGRRPWGLGTALLAVALAPTLLGDVNRVVGWQSPQLGWGFALYQVLYAVAGALLLSAKNTGRGARRLLWAVLALAGVAGVLWYQHAIHYTIAYASVFVAVFAGALMLSLKDIRVPERHRPLLSVLGTAAFGAYMVHLLLIKTLAKPLVSADAGWLQAPAAAAGLTLGTIVLSFAASVLWGRLGLRRYLG